MMTGCVCSKGLGLSGNQVSKLLRRVNPVSHSRRREDMVRRQNPVPYYAQYFGNKLHCDQNEKLAMYGCTFFAISDGCSSKIVRLFSMPKKNAVIIYSHFRLVLVFFIVVPIFFLDRLNYIACFNDPCALLLKMESEKISLFHLINGKGALQKSNISQRNSLLKHNKFLLPRKTSLVTGSDKKQLYS